MRKISSVIFIIILLLLVFPLQVFADSEFGFGITPAKVYISNLYPGSLESFNITIDNQTSTSSDYLIVARTPDIDTTGYDPLNANQYSWFQYNNEITIPGNSQQDITITINVPSSIESNTNVEAWIGITENITGLRYELAAKVFLSINSKKIAGKNITITTNGELGMLASNTTPITTETTTNDESSSFWTVAISSSGKYVAAKTNKPFNSIFAIVPLAALLIIILIIILVRRRNMANRSMQVKFFMTRRKIDVEIYIAEKLENDETRAIVGASVTLADWNSVLTGDNGIATFKDVGKGEYDIIVKHEDFEDLIDKIKIL